jgi:cell division protein FtsN
VIIRNPQNGKFVIGALFGREREFSGPSLQLSSDAADALGILAKQPTNVSVVALRSRTVPEETPEAEMVENQVIEESLDPIQKNADTAIASADTPMPKLKPSSLITPYLQIGIFSVEANARGSVSSMTTKGLSASMSKLTLNNKPFWRVIVGPAATTTEMAAMRTTVIDSGFADAYAVKN